MRKLALLLCLLISGCTASCQQNAKVWNADTFGLRRKITMYNWNGFPYREWVTTTKVDFKGEHVIFLDEKGRMVILSGTYTIEELSPEKS